MSLYDMVNKEAEKRRQYQIDEEKKRIKAIQKKEKQDKIDAMFALATAAAEKEAKALIMKG